MQYDRQLTISTAGNRRALLWPAQTLMWSELVEKLKNPARSTESLTQYLRLPKSKQDDLKDVGGFVAGTLGENRRKAANVTGRDILTLDLDNIPAGETDNILRRIEGLGCSYAVYSTRKHEPAKPRLRILVPLSRTVTADEYEPIARKLAGFIGLELCDPSTFEASRLMYWPSCCSDSQYVYAIGDKPFLDADGVLGLYADWQDIAQWPQVPGVQQSHVRLAAKQGDPTAKQGIVGAFCKIYDVSRAIDVFLPGEYTPVDDGRFTFVGGSTTGGAVIYDNGNFLYSHHATDPAGGKLCNAFDLVRMHKFGELDDDTKPDTPTNRLPSYAAMREFAVQDTAVAAILNTERYERATEDFKDDTDGENTDWMRRLSISPTTGTPQKTTDNVLIILENDPLLKGKQGFDEFASRGLALGSLPWDKNEQRRNWSDTDDAGLRHYLEKVYGITGRDRILDATVLCAHKNTINDVQEYLSRLLWDGTPRLDTLLYDYLGCEDNLYTRAVSRKSLVAAVARAMTPGCKYDCMTILSGPQGIGKSTLLRLLGQSWYSDSLNTFEGKEASEMIQGVWINELGELNGLTRSENNAVKLFLSKTEDIFRAPYGRNTNRYPRRCVFFGTTNDMEFLRDYTGNRRFWPVDVGRECPSKSVFNDLHYEIDQIWAEAVTRWKAGESLYLTDEAADIALQEQETHRVSNAKEGLIQDFLAKPIPLDWAKRDLARRRIWWGGDFERINAETMDRDRVCAIEVWCECLGGDIKQMKRADSVEITGILSRLPGWQRHNSTMRFGPYGPQKGYVAESVTGV